MIRTNEKLWVVYDRGGMSKEDTIELWEKEKNLQFKEERKGGNLIFIDKDANT